MQDDFPHAAHHKEVAIHISNYTLRHSDTGLVIVGGSMVVQPQVLQRSSLHEVVVMCELNNEMYM